MKQFLVEVQMNSTCLEKNSGKYFLRAVAPHKTAPTNNALIPIIALTKTWLLFYLNYNTRKHSLYLRSFRKCQLCCLNTVILMKQLAIFWFILSRALYLCCVQYWKSKHDLSQIQFLSNCVGCEVYQELIKSKIKINTKWVDFVLNEIDLIFYLQIDFICWIWHCSHYYAIVFVSILIRWNFLLQCNCNYKNRNLIVFVHNFWQLQTYFSGIWSIQTVFYYLHF